MQSWEEKDIRKEMESSSKKVIKIKTKRMNFDKKQWKNQKKRKEGTKCKR